MKKVFLDQVCIKSLDEKKMESQQKVKLNEVKFKTKDKFEDKLLVWAIILQLGISRPHITPSGIAIYEDTYTDNCIAKNWCLKYEISQKTFDIYFGSLLEQSRLVVNDQNIKLVPKLGKLFKYTRYSLYRRFFRFNQMKSLQRWLGGRKLGY